MGALGQKSGNGVTKRIPIEHPYLENIVKWVYLDLETTKGMYHINTYCQTRYTRITTPCSFKPDNEYSPVDHPPIEIYTSMEKGAEISTLRVDHNRGCCIRDNYGIYVKKYIVRSGARPPHPPAVCWVSCGCEMRREGIRLLAGAAVGVIISTPFPYHFQIHYGGQDSSLLPGY